MKGLQAGLVVSALAVGAIAADLDPVVLQVAHQSPRWVQVAAPPADHFWTSPAAEILDDGSITIGRKDSVQLLIPAASSIGFRAEHPLGQEDLKLYISDGNGLGKRIDIDRILDSDRKSGVIQPTTGHRILRLEGGSGLESDLRLLLVKRQILPTRIRQNYRPLGRLDGIPLVTLKEFKGKSRTDVVVLEAWSPLEIPIEGPAHLRLGSRLPYPARTTDHRQTCELLTSVDQAPAAVHHLNFVAGGRPMEISGQVIALSQPSYTFVDIGDGPHTLHLMAPRRLMISVEGAAWIEPVLNVNRVEPEPSDVWRTTAGSTSATGSDPQWLLTELQHGNTLKRAFDTNAVLEAQALNHLELPQLASLARLIAGRTLFYRDLEPLAPRSGIFRRAYHRQRLKLPPTGRRSQIDPPIALPAPVATRLADSIPEANFVPLESGENLEFSLPPQPVTRIRVAVVTIPDHSETLKLSSDCGDSEEILLDPLLIAPEEIGRASLASLAHAIEREQFGELGAPFRQISPLQADRVSSLVVDLSPGCRRLSLIRSGDGPPFAVALAAQTERDQSISEQAMIDLLRSVDRDDPLGATARRTLDVFQDELQKRIQETIEKEVEIVGISALPWRLDDRTDEVYWDPAVDPIIQLERLTRDLREHGGGWTNVEYIVRALDLLGENFLAKGVLRAVALKAPTIQVRRHAARALLDRARSNGESGLTAAIILSQSQDGEPAYQNELGSALLAAGNPRDALVPSFMSGSAGNPQIAEISTALDWWELPQDLDAEAEVRAAAWLDPSRVQDTASEIPEVTDEIDLHRRLTDENLAIRSQALLRWESLVGNPHDPMWRRLDRRAVKAHGGGILFRSRTSGATGRRWLASPENPLVLEVAPGEIRLEIRALLPAELAQSNSQWLLASFCGFTRPVFVRGGPASTALDLPSRKDHQLGITRQATVRIPPGCWQLTLRPESDPVAIRVDRPVSGFVSPLPDFEPENATKVLLPPPLEPAWPPSRSVLVTPPPIRSGVLVEDSSQAPQAPLDTNEAVPVQPVVQSSTAPLADIYSLSPSVASRLGLRLGLAPEPDWLETVARSIPHGPELLIATAAWRGLDAACSYPRINADTADFVAFACVGANQIDSALNAFSEGITQAQGDQQLHLKRLRLEMAIYAADHGLISRQAAIVEAAEIVQNHPGDSSLARMADHVLEQTSWRRLTPSLSGGLRLVEVPGWHRSETSMRARLALLDHEPNAVRYLAGDESINLEIGNQTPSTSRLEIRAHGLSIFRPEPLTAVWKLLDQDGNNLLLAQGAVEISPGQKKIVLIDVPAGRSLLQITSLKPRPNQMLSIRLDEAGDDGGSRQMLLNEALARRLRFDVAEQNQPIEIALSGPAWLRADHLSDSGIRRTYHRIEPGSQIFRIETTGEELVRLWALEPEITTIQPIVGETSPRPVDSPVPSLNREAPTGNEHRAEALITGSSPATQDVSVFWRRRRSFDEDDSDDEAEEHVEARYRRRIYLNANHFRESTLLTRIHEGTDLVVGASEDHQLLYSDWRLRLSARVFVEEPVGRDVPTDSPWWSVEGRAGIERWFFISPRLLHRPGILTRARVLSLDQDEAGAVGTIDNDVWTPYKANHRFALRLSDRLDFRAFDDMKLWARASLTTNEDPFGDGFDNLRFAIGATQLVGDLEARAFISSSTYFSDNDRRTQTTRPLLGLDVLFDRWLLSGHRLMAQFSLRHEIDSGRNSVGVGLTWVFEQGLPWRNQPPRTDPFRSRKRRRVAERTALDIEP